MNAVVNLSGPNLPTLVGVTRGDAIERLGGPEGILNPGLFGYGLCPIPLFPEDIIHLADLVYSLKGTERVTTPAEYYRLPAIYIEASRVIASEWNRIGVSRGNS